MKTVNGIFKLMLGTSAIILSVAAFAYTTKPASAEPLTTNKNMMLPQTLPDYGKYHVQYECGLDGNDKFYWHACVSNTETGKFIIYRWAKDTQEWKDQFGKQAPKLP